MTSEHTMRRVGRIHAYPGFKNSADDYLIVLLDDALAYFLDFTHRGQDPGEQVDSIVCGIARTMHSHMGAEGVIRAKDGEMIRQWSEQGGFDPSLLRQMKSYRLVVGVNATNAV